MDDNDVKPQIQSIDGLTDQQQQQSQPSISSFYPLPPMRYIKQFTDVNVRNRTTPLPPKPFTNGSYLMFGQTITIDDMIIRSLESQGLRRLYGRDYDHKKELKKINVSILVNFLDLIDVLIHCPDTRKREEKCTDLQLLFITMHHLINELRPHQARESIRVCLKMQKKTRRETTMRLLKQIERVQEIIRNAIKNIKDKDISTLLQETAPEKFQQQTSTTTATTIGQNNHISSLQQHQPLFSPLTTGTTFGHYSDPSLLTNGGGGGENPPTCLAKNDLPETAKLAELDAFMCDLVDETLKHEPNS